MSKRPHALYEDYVAVNKELLELAQVLFYTKKMRTLDEIKRAILSCAEAKEFIGKLTTMTIREIESLLIDLICLKNPLQDDIGLLIFQLKDKI